MVKYIIGIVIVLIGILIVGFGWIVVSIHGLQYLGVIASPLFSIKYGVISLPIGYFLFGLGFWLKSK
jgi:hypothetical protein